MNRHDFLRQMSLLMGGVAVGVQGIPVRASAYNPWLINGSAPADTILVLVQLQGGNDGLNTVVPFENDIYYQKRPAIAIAKNSVLKLTDQLGLNPALAGFRELYHNAQLTIVQNVGYESPNRSHFRSTDIWLSGSDANVQEEEGWVGRYLQKKFPAYPVTLPQQPMAIQLGSVESMLLQSNVGSMGTVFDNPDSFYQLVKGTSNDAGTLQNTLAGDELRFLNQVAAQSIRYSDVIKQKADAGKNTVTYPNTNLGKQLAIVADLISGGLTTPVYLTTLNGFDTHANQVTAGNTTAGLHTTLLQTVSEAITAFQKDLTRQNLADRVTIMTFSEFGRRLNQNGTTGTDHGTAAPLFVIGKTVRGGIIGSAPNLGDLDPSGDIRFKSDFRQVYASVLQDHLGVSADTSQQLLGRSFETLPIFRQTSALEVTTGSFALGQNAPNPFVDTTEIQFSLKKAQYARLTVFDLQGRPLQVLRDGFYDAGNYVVPLNGTGLVAGYYLYSLHTDSGQAVMRMVKT